MWGVKSSIEYDLPPWWQMNSGPMEMGLTKGCPSILTVNCTRWSSSTGVLIPGMLGVSIFSRATLLPLPLSLGKLCDNIALEP